MSPLEVFIQQIKKVFMQANIVTHIRVGDYGNKNQINMKELEDLNLFYSFVNKPTGVKIHV